MVDFSGAAGQGSSTDLIPAGQLAWAWITFKGHTESRTSSSKYIDLELTIDEGQPFARRKVWTKVGDPVWNGNSETYRQMGFVAIGRILEAGNNAGPHNPAGYQLPDLPNHPGVPDYSKLHGMRVPIKIGIEKGQQGYSDKNGVAEFLTPNPQSASFKTFERLSRGEYSPPGAPASQGAAPAQGSLGFGGAPAGAAPAPAGFANAGFGGGQQPPSAAPVAQGFQQPQQQPQAAGWGAPSATHAGGQPPTPTSPQGMAPAAIPTPPPSSGAPGAPPQPAWLAQANGAPQH